MAEFISAHHYKYDLNGNVILEQDTEIASDDSGITYTIQDLGNDTYVSDYGWGMETQEGAVIQTTSGFRRTYSWNERNLITTTSDNRYLVNYRYDHSGERVGKFAVQNNGGSASETLYFNKMWSWRYDGLQSERLGRNSKHIYLGATRILTKVARADGYETSEDSIKQYYYHNDHLGSAQLITNADGEEYERIEYTPYGELWVEKASAASNIDIPYRFTGKERDEETGLYYFGARYLDPKTSRWLSADPALGDYIPGAPVNDEAKKRNGNLPGMGGVFNLVNLHLYHYAGNNPVKYIDPDGRIQFQVQSKYTMQNSSWGFRNLTGTTGEDNTLGRAGCAVAGAANLFNTFGINDMNPAKVNKEFVSGGSLNWDAVGERLGMDVTAVSGKPLTIDTLKKQHSDSSKGYLTLVNVNYDSKKGDHWVGIKGALTKDGIDYLIISGTSDNDSAVGKDNLRGKQGWLKGSNGEILVPVSETKGYVNFTAPVVYE
ncbi:MAG TPA: RHS repeat-associated core domain-containing protein [Treponemataceae bacterium]|mgnify:FL=1|nr:RHS repeat-associated core domain-containing protein [Treponemataceae bacterium]HOS35281.1 RHS repeat-associated core domain-containing protein [Treponemataceae bacterium]